MNVTILKGNLTRDPELKEFGDNKKVINFSIAVNRSFKRKDGSKDSETTFVDCEAWDTAAEIIHRYVKKGNPLLVQGSLKTDTWETDGQKRSKLKLRVTTFELLGGKPSQDQSQEAAAAATGGEGFGGDGSPEAGGDDIPF